MDIMCPECGGKTVLRTVKKGPNIGQRFYVCSNFPNCRGRVAEKVAEMISDEDIYEENPPSTKEKSWLVRHPNTFILISWIVLYILLVVAFVVADSLNSFDSTQKDILFSGCYVIAIIIGMWATGYGLSLKGQSSWWLLLLFVPFGWIGVFALSNKKISR